MANFVLTQNSFAAGEVSSEFFARENLNGLSRLRNMDVLPAGGIRRRRGLQTVTTSHTGAILIPFSVAEGDDYLLAVRAGQITIYKDGTPVSAIPSPWGGDDLRHLQYAQRFGTMIFVHPDYKPQVLKKNGDIFDLTVFGFAEDEQTNLKIPFMKFDDAFGIKITVTARAGAANNTANLTADHDFWTPENVGGQLFMLDVQWNVIEYVGPRQVVATAKTPYATPTAPVSDWREAAFGTRRGWPASITFHQNRLVFGGSRSHPAGVWMSKVGEHSNFDVGTGLADEAIFITLLSDQRQQICTIISSDNLQILTSAGEWAISNKPLTPESVNIKQHTSVGSFAGRFLPPQKIEGGTAFIAASGRDIREMALDELGENYRANDLCALSRHLITDPIDLAYNDRDGQLFVVMADGKMAVLNKNSSLGISAWGVYETDGLFKSVAVMSGETYVTTQRGENTYIEKFSDDAIADGYNHPFAFTASGMPVLSSKHSPKNIRVRKLSARVLDTKALMLNGHDVNLPNKIYADGAPGYTGDVSVNLLGSAPDAAAPIWTASGDASFPATILSVTVNGFYNI